MYFVRESGLYSLLSGYSKNCASALCCPGWCSYVVCRMWPLLRPAGVLRKRQGVVFFVYSTGIFNIIALDHMNKVEENCVCRKHQTLQNELDFAGLEGLEGVKVGNIKHQTNIVALTVDVKMAKLHISRPVQLWCGDYPAGLCRVSVGQKIHAVCLSNGCAGSASD